jgi:deoxyribose-phosphate aldolase
VHGLHGKSIDGSDVRTETKENRVKSAAKPLPSELRNEIDAACARWSSRDPSEEEIVSATSTSFVETLRAAKSGSLSGSELAKLIDHTLLKADARRAELEALCAEARENDFATVCVNASALSDAKAFLGSAHSQPIAVVGFPLGAMDARAKAEEARLAVELGAREIDMVLRIGSLKDGDFATVFEDISAVVQASASAPVKVILETTYLDRGEIIAASLLSKAAGAAFVKTSTGFASSKDGKPTGATPQDIALMRVVVGPKVGVKASGGIRSREDALRMIANGANRIGASASVAIVKATSAGTGNY